MKIKKGATRIVFVFKRNVVKIPNVNKYQLFLNGILANLQEKSFSKLGRKDLAKVKYCDRFGLFLIMERVTELDNENIPIRRWKREMKKIYEDDILEEFMLSDLKPSNWGYIEGFGDVESRFVKFDYGN